MTKTAHELGLSRQTKELVQNWIRARRIREDALSRAVTARIEENKATQELGKFLTPDDLQDDERVLLWVGDSLLSIRRNKLTDDEYIITIRQKGKDLNEL